MQDFESAEDAVAARDIGMAEAQVRAVKTVLQRLLPVGVDADRNGTTGQPHGTLGSEFNVRAVVSELYGGGWVDVTGSLPDVAGQVRQQLAAHEAVLDGEAIAVDTAGRPLPFQHLMRRFRRKHAVAATVEEIPVQLYLFDALHTDGKTLLDAPYQERWAALEKAAGKLNLVRRLIPKTVEEGEAFAQAERDGRDQ